MKFDQTIKWPILILVLLLVPLGYLRIVFPELNHGDEYSDANVLNAGENFVRFGFKKTVFLPIFEPNAQAPTNAYTHYPPLPDIINGTLRMLLKTDNIILFRLFSIFMSFLGVCFWFIFIRKFTDSEVIAFFASLFYITNPFFISNMDSLHQCAYSEFFRSAILLFFVMALEARGPKRKFLMAGLWIGFFLLSLTTFEYILFFAIFFVMFHLLFKRSKGSFLKKEIAFFLAAPFFAILLHYFQNAIYFGSFSLAFDDLRAAAAQRILSIGQAEKITFIIWLKSVLLRNFNRALLFQGFFVFSLSLFAWALTSALSQEDKKRLTDYAKLTVIFLVCGISWYVFFPAHSLHHSYLDFLPRHLVLSAACFFSMLVAALLFFQRDSQKKNFSFLSAALIFAVLIAATGVLKSDLPIKDERIQYEKDFLVFKQCLLEFRQRTGPEGKLAVNYFRFPFIKFYADKSTRPVFTKQDLLDSSGMPEYFILFPYENPQTIELFEYVKEKYDFVFRCNSARFPAMFFKLKGNSPS